MQLNFVQDNIISFDSLNLRTHTYFHEIFPLSLLSNTVDHIISTKPLTHQSDTDNNQPNPTLKRKGINIEYEEILNPFYTILNNCIHQANQNYNFDLDFIDELIYMEYSSSNSGLRWHMDIGENRSSLRKLSFSIFLNDLNEFEGGELEIMRDEKNLRIQSHTGSIILFPSYLQHRVTPIIKGVRKVIVGFIGGRPFR
tara:strand:+ start:240 stop:833 length:594 start_codon:yes stop_codon:yes gene_type:complete